MDAQVAVFYLDSLCVTVRAPGSQMLRKGKHLCGYPGGTSWIATGLALSSASSRHNPSVVSRAGNAEHDVLGRYRSLYVKMH